MSTLEFLKYVGFWLDQLFAMAAIAFVLGLAIQLGFRLSGDR